MYRILQVLFAMVVLFFVGAAHAENHDKSLHLILADDGRDGNGRTAGAVEVRQHGKDGRDGGTVIQRQEFPDITSLMAGYEDLYRQLFGDEETPCLLPKAQQGAVEGLVMAAGTPGTDRLPGDYGDGWSGSAGGGCGTWATAMCNRILGKASGAVTKSEWNTIAAGIGQNAGGGSNATNRAAYYQSEHGCDTSHSTYTGSAADHAFIKKKLQEGYDLKLRFYEIIYNEAGDIVDYDHGHVETVTGATTSGGERIVITNSWGNQARIRGGTRNNFSHSKYPNTYPKSKTLVRLDVVGPC
ncbi:MAG: hypothetical protein VXW22_09140 [Pseudomonadota bacterium]|nr:hypothetical protein [Pseudomonadota bacterium]